jgi:hypothetical protein
MAINRLRCDLCITAPIVVERKDKWPLDGDIGKWPIPIPFGRQSTVTPHIEELAVTAAALALAASGFAQDARSIFQDIYTRIDAAVAAKDQATIDRLDVGDLTQPHACETRLPE